MFFVLAAVTALENLAGIWRPVALEPSSNLLLSQIIALVCPVEVRVENA